MASSLTSVFCLLVRFLLVLTVCLPVGCSRSNLTGPLSGNASDSANLEAGPAYPRQDHGQSVHGSAYVSEASCGSCHAAAAAAWQGSHHDLAMQPANEATVLGDFGDTAFTVNGETNRFLKREGRFYVATTGPDGKPGEFEVTHTFGISPLQQYLAVLPGGRLQSLTVAWHVDEQRWFYLHPGEFIDHASPRHWSGRLYRWNDRCAECHATHLRMGYRGDTDTFETTWSRDDVGCQACHGPAEAHLRWANQPEDERVADGTFGLVVPTSGVDGPTQVAACAPCHARRHPLTPEPRPGTPLLDNYMPALLRGELYHADGQIDDEVYVYGSFVQSKMYMRGVRCTDCHDPHSLALKAEGDALCVQCHNPAGNPRFETLVRKSYATPAHHFHEQGSEAARCVSCHMPAKTYMVVDPRRDHSMRIPRPDLSAAIGTPNACNGCHTDQTAAWAAEAVIRWYGTDTSRQPHYGQVFARARRGDTEVLEDLQQLALDKNQPGIVRATAVSHLGPHGLEAREAVAAALADEDPLVRATAVRAAEFWPPPIRVPALWPLLSDPIRGVRLQTGMALADIPPGDLEAPDRQKLEAAVIAYEQAQHAAGPQPEPYANLGILYTRLGRFEEAERAYLRAIEIGPELSAPRVNLANLYNRLGRNDEAVFQFREAIAYFPEEGELYYSLGLLSAEMGDYPAAAGNLVRAAELMPDRERVHFNLGKVLLFLGESEQGERALLRAHELQPRNPEYLQELVSAYIRLEQWQKALTQAQKLTVLTPGNASLELIIDRIREQIE